MTGDRDLRLALGACAGVVVAFAIGAVGVLAVGLLLAGPSVAVPGLGFAIVGSVQIVTLALVVAAPLGVGAGVFLAEYGTSGPPAQMIRALSQDVSAIPALAHGVFGFAVFGGLLGLGPTVLTAGLTLALLVVPGIVEATEDAVRRVPARQREAALALGATRFQVALRVVLPSASRGVAGGVLRATARALGEAAPLIVIGAVVVRAGAEGFSAVPFRLWVLAETPGREAYALALALGLVAVGLAVSGARLRAGGSER